MYSHSPHSSGNLFGLVDYVKKKGKFHARESGPKKGKRQKAKPPLPIHLRQRELQRSCLQMRQGPTPLTLSKGLKMKEK